MRAMERLVGVSNTFISKKSKTAPVAPVSIANSRKRRSYILLP